MAEEGYFYGAPGVFPSLSGVSGDGEATVPPFTQEQLVEALSMLAAASNTPATSTKPPKPSWASIAATKPCKDAKIVVDEAPAPSMGSRGASAPEDTRPNCVFYLNGNCRWGDSCRFRHVKAQTEAIEFFIGLMQLERSKDILAAEPVPEVSSLLADLRESSEEYKPPPGTDPDKAKDEAFAAESDAWQSEALAEKNRMLQKAIDAGVVPSISEAETALQVAERNLSADVTCGICFEHIVDAPGGRFGLLTGCSHAFCLECIRQWRARVDLPKDTVRSCPLCRVISYFVIPCDRYVTDPARKAFINSEYHASQKTIPCRYFDYGRGTCPFGSSCRYAHLNPDGSVAQSTRPALRLDSEGAVAMGRPYKLSEFL